MIQKIKVTTFIKLDFVDLIKVLFGRTIKVETNIDIPQDLPIDAYNADTEVETVNTGAYFSKQDKRNFGWSKKD
jgi:hypothetical protein